MTDADTRTMRSGAIAELHSILLSTAGVEEFIEGVAAAAARHVAPRTAVTVTLQRAGVPTALASSDDRAAACDEVEYANGSGPCLSAIAQGETIIVPDVSVETRWPEWRTAAAAQGFRSGAAFPADVAEGTSIALNLYSEETDAWDEAAQERALVYAEETARTLRLSLRFADLTAMNADLQNALASRSIIDQAMGVIMAENRCSADEAFAVLRSASQGRNIKLRDVAAALIEGITGSPPQEPRGFRPAHR